VCQQIQTRSHDGGTQQKTELSHVEEKTRGTVHEERVVFCERIRVIHIQQLDAKEHQASSTNIGIVFKGRRLVLKEFTGNHHNAL
jgi:hypothetical protein